MNTYNYRDAQALRSIVRNVLIRSGKAVAINTRALEHHITTMNNSRANMWAAATSIYEQPSPYSDTLSKSQKQALDLCQGIIKEMGSYGDWNDRITRIRKLLIQ